MNGQTNTMPTNTDVVRGFYEAIFSGEIDAATKMIATDFLLREAPSLPYGGSFAGRAGLLELVGKIADCWDKFSLLDTRFAETDDLVVAIVSVSAVSKATGKPFAMKIAEAWTVRDGLIAEADIFYQDTHALREICGMN